MKHAIVKFNNGNGALLCNSCKTIVAYGFDHEDKVHICKECKMKEVGSVFHDQYEFLQAGDVEQFTYEAENLALRLVKEEYRELFNTDEYIPPPSSSVPTDTNAIKEALDLMYVTAQYLNVTIGPDKAKECWDALHANNMSKCTNGKLLKREDGKVLKPEGYEKLDLTSVL